MPLGGKTSASIATNTFILTFGQLLGRVTGFIFIPLIARKMGSAELAAYQLGNLFLVYFSILVLFGMSPLLVRDMVQKPQDISRLFGEALGLRLIFALVAFSLLAGLLFVLNYPALVTIITMILSVGLFVNALTDTIDIVFQANEKMYYSVVVVLSSTLLYLVVGWFAFTAGYGVIGLAAANTLGMVFRAFIALFIVARKFFIPKIIFHWNSQKVLLKAAIPFFLGGASAYVLSKIDVFILSRMVPLTIVGYYTAGYLFLDLALLLPGNFAQAIYPALSRAAADSSGNILQETTNRLFKIIFAVGLIVPVVVTPLAACLVHFIYGTNFEPSILVCQIVIWSIVLVGFNNTVGRAIYAAGGQWQLIIVTMVSAVSNVLLNIFLIPAYGIIASSIATLVSFAVAVAAHAYYARRFKCSVRFLPLVRISIGLIPGLIAGYYLLHIHWVAVLIGVPIVYIGGIFLSGLFTVEELKKIKLMFYVSNS
jgi:PST family polysaccharide transporter